MIADSRDSIKTTKAFFLKYRSQIELINLLEVLFSSTDLKRLELRSQILLGLLLGKTYNEIEKEIGASSATIARISDKLAQQDGELRKLALRLTKN